MLGDSLGSMFPHVAVVGYGPIGQGGGLVASNKALTATQLEKQRGSTLMA